MNLDESRWPDAEHCWLLQAMLVFLLASSRIPPNFLCAQKIPCFTQWWNIYIYIYEYIYMLLGTRSCHCNILQQGHLNQSCLRLKKFLAFVFQRFSEENKRFEISAQEPFQPERCTDGFWGKLMDNSHISDLGVPWAWRSRQIKPLHLCYLEIFGHFGLCGSFHQNPQSSHSQTRTPVSLLSLRTAPREKNTAVPPRVRRCISAVRSEEAQLCLACCWAIGDNWRAEITEIIRGEILHRPECWCHFKNACAAFSLCCNWNIRILEMHVTANRHRMICQFFISDFGWFWWVFMWHGAWPDYQQTTPTQMRWSIAWSW